MSLFKNRLPVPEHDVPSKRSEAKPPAPTPARHVRQDITSRKPSPGEQFAIWFLPLLLGVIQRLYGMTFRRIYIGKEGAETLRAGNKPWIYGIWHTNVLFSPYLLRKDHFYGLVSNSKDGEMITRVLRHFGNDAIRGSSSRGGMQALRRIIAALGRGNVVAITPDGPRGPAFELKDGIIHAARTSGAPVIPFYYAATKQWVLEKSWDRHIIPKPFSTLVISYGAPVDVKKLAQDKSDEKLKEELKKEMMNNIKRCHEEISKLKKS